MQGRSTRGGQHIGVAGGDAVSARLRVGEEVASALADRSAVVGLETSVIGQGLPFPRNVECIDRMVDAIRSAGAVPAWVGVVEGEVVVGLSDEELGPFTEPGRAVKVARRDLPAACARGGLGATTVSATIWAAARAGITVSATGGIGGVHPGERSDVSADLVELSRTPGLLVCSGPKSIIDPFATAERLEELGVTLVGYGVSRLPFFLVREAPIELEHRVDTPQEAAAILGAATDLDTRSILLLCNPVPAEHAMNLDELASAVASAETQATSEGVRGKARTPYLLSAIAELTGGRSWEANLALLASNAALAGDVASAADAVGRPDRRR